MGVAGASTALQVAGAANSAVGAYYGAKSQKSSLEYQAMIDGINAGQSELSAQQELLKGESGVAQVTQRAGQIKSAQKTAMAANGIDIGSGSASEVLTSTDIMKEQDANTITANAVRSAWGYRTQTTNFQNDARMKRAGADSISPMMAAQSSLLGSASGVASSWYSANKVGAK